MLAVARLSSSDVRRPLLVLPPVWEGRMKEPVLMDLGSSILLALWKVHQVSIAWHLELPGWFRFLPLEGFPWLSWQWKFVLYIC